jgi:hypothetical protein
MKSGRLVVLFHELTAHDFCLVVRKSTAQHKLPEKHHLVDSLKPDRVTVKAAAVQQTRPLNSSSLTSQSPGTARNGSSIEDEPVRGQQ